MAGYTKWLASHPPPVTLELPQGCCHLGCLPDCLFHPNAEVFTSAPPPPPPPTHFDPLKYLCRGDIQVNPNAISVPLKHSKTCQFREACPHLPLPALPGNSTLCPVTAVVRLLSLCPSLPATAPLFCYPTPDGLVMLTQPMMELRLRTHIAGAGLQSANYGTHSLRRGGASWAFQSGMPAKLIKVFGGWGSNCYQIYLDMTLDTKFQMMKHFVKHLPS